MEPWATDRRNPNAGAQAFLWAFASWVVLLVVVGAADDKHTDAFVAGRVLVPAVAAGVLIWLIARNADRFWPWWVYPLAVPLVAAVIALPTNLPSLAGGEPSDRAG